MLKQQNRQSSNRVCAVRTHVVGVNAGYGLLIDYLFLTVLSLTLSALSKHIVKPCVFCGL